jgi:hypothetical protein
MAPARPRAGAVSLREPDEREQQPRVISHSCVDACTRPAFQRRPHVSRSACLSGSIAPPIRHAPVMTCAPFKAITVASDPKDPMPTVKHASTIIGAFEEARSEIIGKAVVLTDGKAGTVENVWLDELHGLRVSIRGHDGKWPISTIKLIQGGGNRL